MVSTAFATVPSAPRSDPQATDPSLVWQRVLSLLKLNTGDAHFDTYLRGTRGLVYDSGASVIRVAAANPFHVPWLEGKLNSTAQRPRGVTPPGGGSPLNARYTFGSFVVGHSNRLAHAASLAIVDHPGTAYNPLFLYGGVGLGKTHLLHAIGQAVAAKGADVVYVSSETFTNELIESIRQHHTDDFRLKFRNAGVLLIGDVQFIT